MGNVVSDIGDFFTGGGVAGFLPTSVTSVIFYPAITISNFLFPGTNNQIINGGTQNTFYNSITDLQIISSNQNYISNNSGIPQITLNIRVLMSNGNYFNNWPASSYSQYNTITGKVYLYHNNVQIDLINYGAGINFIDYTTSRATTFPISKTVNMIKGNNTFYAKFEGFVFVESNKAWFALPSVSYTKDIIAPSITYDFPTYIIEMPITDSINIVPIYQFPPSTISVSTTTEIFSISPAFNVPGLTFSSSNGSITGLLRTPLNTTLYTVTLSNSICFQSTTINLTIFNSFNFNGTTYNNQFRDFNLTSWFYEPNVVKNALITHDRSRYEIQIQNNHYLFETDSTNPQRIKLKSNVLSSPIDSLQQCTLLLLSYELDVINGQPGVKKIITGQIQNITIEFINTVNFNGGSIKNVYINEKNIVNNQPVYVADINNSTSLYIEFIILDYYMFNIGKFSFYIFGSYGLFQVIPAISFNYESDEKLYSFNLRINAYIRRRDKPDRPDYTKGIQYTSTQQINFNIVDVVEPFFFQYGNAYTYSINENINVNTNFITVNVNNPDKKTLNYTIIANAQDDSSSFYVSPVQNITPNFLEEFYLYFNNSPN